MRKTRYLFLLLPLAVIVLASPFSAYAGGKRPQAKIESVMPLSGQHLAATLLVKDPESRDLPLSFEFKVKGRKGWFPATMATDIDAVPSDPEGRSFVAVWSAYEDLGAVSIRKARLRVTVEVEKGKRKKSKKFEVVTYGDLPGADLRADLYPDLAADGTLTDFVLVDTRGEISFADGSVPGAVNLSASDIEEKGDEVLPFSKDTRLVFYCYGGL